jgi:hypothetical protein
LEEQAEELTQAVNHFRVGDEDLAVETRRSPAGSQRQAGPAARSPGARAPLRAAAPVTGKRKLAAVSDDQWTEF